MRSARTALLALTLVVVMVVLQTAVAARFPLFGVVPDLVLLSVILLAHRVRPMATLLLGFTGGLLLDSLGTTALGLRALAFTVVAYLAVVTRERAEVNAAAMALSVLGLSVVGVVLFLMVTTLFSQQTLVGAGLLRRVTLLPVLNLAVAVAAAPLMARMFSSETRR